VCAVVLTLVFIHPLREPARAAEPIRVYVFAGQSNMVGKDASASELTGFAPSALAPSRRILFWGPYADHPTTWAPLQAPTEIAQARHHEGFGPEIGASQLLARHHPSSTIAIVKAAWSGTSLYRDWDPARPGYLYDRMLARVRAGIARLRLTSDSPVELSGFFWMQGEADSMHARWASAYADNLAGLIRALRRDLHAPALPFVLGRITDLRRDSPAHFPFSGIVRRAQGGVARTVPSTYMVKTDDLERSRVVSIHFSSRGTYELGRRFVQPSFPL
jgi:hypothetical protein